MERLTYKDSTLPRTTEHGELIRAYSDYNPRTIINKLSEYEDLEEQGRLVVLPCKVGDTVWGVIFDTRDCPHCVGLSGCFGCSKANPVDVYRTDFKLHMVEEIGKTVFLTRAEAEDAMKGVSEDGD